MGGHKKKGKESTTSTLCGGLIFLGAFSKSFRGCGPLMTRIKMRYLNANIFFHLTKILVFCLATLEHGFLSQFAFSLDFLEDRTWKMLAKWHTDHT